MAASSKGAVVAALAGNGSLTIIKFVAFLFSGSGAMLSEAIHSFADTANQFLLFLGIQQSEKPADAVFNYGYGGFSGETVRARVVGDSLVGVTLPFTDAVGGPPPEEVDFVARRVACSSVDAGSL